MPKKSKVFNVLYYDSEESGQEEEIDTMEQDTDYDLADQETEDKGEYLQNLLKEVANVCTIGLKAYKIDFFDRSPKKFEDKNCNADFDYQKGIPIMYDGGEEFIAPWLKKLSQKVKFFKDCSFETNHNLLIKLS